MKRKLIITLSTLLVLGLVTGCGCKKKENKENNKIKEEQKVTANVEEDVIKDQKVDGIEMTNTSLIIKDGISKLVTKVTNNSDEDYKLNEYIITVKDKDGKIITTIPGYVGDTIKKGETRILNSSIDIDLTNAKSIEYEVKK